MSRTTQADVDVRVADCRVLLKAHGDVSVSLDWGIIVALADDLKAAQEEHLTSDLAGLKLAERVTALTADRDSWRRVCETLQSENDAMAALLGIIPDAIILAFDCEDDEGNIAPSCAWLPEKECQYHRRRAVLAARAKRMGETGGGT